MGILLRALLFCLMFTAALHAQYAPVITSTACDVGCEEEACPCFESGYYASVDYLNWKVHARSQDYATTEDGLSLAIGAGESHRVDFDRDSGIRGGLGYMTNVGWGVKAEYTHFETEGHDSIVRPGGVGQLFSTLSHPGGPEEADTAVASSSFDYNVFDLLFQTSLIDEKFKGVQLFGGIRWANIDQSLMVNYDGRDFVNGVIDDTLSINAFGFIFGGEAQWRMANGWSPFGRCSIAGLYGRMENLRTETNLNGFEQLVDFRDQYREGLFNFEARLGMEKKISNYAIRAGYDLNVWTHLGDRVRFYDDIEEASFGTASGDILLEGFFVQLTGRW